MSLKRAYKTYQANKAAWVAEGKEGLYVVIHHERVVGFFPDIRAALTAGYDDCGIDEPFMAHRIAKHEPPVPVSRRTAHAFDNP